MALIPLVGALGNMDAAQLATDCACMLGSFAKTAVLGTTRGALVQRVASPTTAASSGTVEAPFGLCLACHEPLGPPSGKLLKMTALGLWEPRKRCATCNEVIKARVAAREAANSWAAGTPTRVQGSRCRTEQHPVLYMAERSVTLAPLRSYSNH